MASNHRTGRKMDADIIVVGGSVRAAAASARRAGLKPWCADFYRDLDTVAMSSGGPPAALTRYSDLRTHFATAPPVPWMYTGCLENHSKLVDELAATRPLWGNDGDALRACRSPARIARLLHTSGLPTLEVRASGDTLTRDRDWVRKPLGSCGGHGVSIVRAGEPRLRGRGHFFQEYAAGTAMSAVFTRVGSEVRLLGVTEQLVAPDGIDWLNAPSFAYAGSIGPVELTPGFRQEVLRGGEVIGNGCGLRGLFGVDFVCRDGRPWVLEVNPRYTASTEVLERAHGIRALDAHRAAFDSHVPVGRLPRAGPNWVAKAVIYAPAAMRVQYPPGFISGGFALEDESASCADLSPAGTSVQAGSPLMTVFGNGKSRDECEASVRRRAADVLAKLMRSRLTTGDRTWGASS